MSQLSTNHVFISYSRRDNEVMRRIVAHLREQGITAWVDNERLVPGTPIWEAEIEKAISNAGAVVVLLSPDSKDSPWVRREISYAEDNDKRIFPVLVAGNEIPIRLTNHQRIDIRENEDVGLNSLTAALSFYLEKLEAQKKNIHDEAEKFSYIEDENRKASERLETEQLTKEKAEAERKARHDAQRLVAQQTSLQNATNEPKTKPKSSDRPAKVLDDYIPRGVESKSFKKMETANISPTIKWGTVFWITLGWVLGFALGSGNISRIIWSFGSGRDSITISYAISGLIAGTIGGLATALKLKGSSAFSYWRSKILITLASAIGFALGEAISYPNLDKIFNTIRGIYYYSYETNIAAAITFAIIGATTGGFGGLSIAIAFKIDKIISNWKNLFIIIATWTIGFAVGEAVGYFLSIIFHTSFFYRNTTNLVIGGALGGFMMAWQLRRATTTNG